MTQSDSNKVYAALRDLDLAAFECESKIKASQTAIEREQAAFEAASAEVESVEAGIKVIRIEERSIDLQIRSIDDEIRKLESASESSSSSQLFGKAEKAIHKKKEERDQLETSGFELLERLETSMAKLKEFQAKAKTHEVSLAAAQSVIAVEVPSLRERLVKIAGEIEALLSGMAVGVGQKYWEAVEHPGRPVFARIKDEACSACGGDLPASMISMAGKGEPSPCPTCKKLLL